MPKTFNAQVAAWVTKVDKVLDAVVSTATANMMADIEIVPGINRGASRRMHGTIPRDLGALARSLESTLMGSTAIQSRGEASHALVAGSMQGGDTGLFLWGGKDAPYAKHVHYGANGVPGTFWVDVAAGKWQSYVSDAVGRAKAELG